MVYDIDHRISKGIFEILNLQQSISETNIYLIEAGAP